MNDYTSLGKFKNAPLIYVLSQIVFDPIPKQISDHVDDFHDAIRDYFPHKIEEQELPLKKNRFEFISRNKKRGVILSDNSLVLHMTEYNDFRDYCNHTRHILEQFMKLIPDNFYYHRIGLRYIDLILPNENLLFERQLKSSFMAHSFPDNMNCQLKHNETLSQYDTEIGSLNLHISQSSGKAILPSNAFPNKLDPPELLTRKSETEGNIGLADIDHYMKKNDVFTVESIMNDFNALHNITKQTFIDIAKNEAIEYWDWESHNE